MEQLGIETVQLLTQVFNFVVMLVLLTKFLYRPILGKLEERRKKIEEGLIFTERARKDLEEIDKKKQEIIDQAKLEARRIIDEGKKSAKNLEREIIEKARQEAVTILEKGGEELKSARWRMERELKVQTVEIAQTMVKRLLEKTLTSSDHQEIIDKKIEEIGKLAK
ncbi:F0F1 ATP synthase subunit B [Candidatus Gottesmanbacteria bacterium]|nr:F0F1 ATP synthase subunit B [Candidatus Gottesmanbacteria bacterium]